LLKASVFAKSTFSRTFTADNKKRSPIRGSTTPRARDAPDPGLSSVVLIFCLAGLTPLAGLFSA